jgi:hypothetical protein
MSRLARTNPTGLRHVAAALVTIAVAALLAACSTPSPGTGSTGAPSTTASGSGTSSTSGTPTASTPAAAPTATTSTPAPGPAGCTPAQLRITTGAIGAGAGQRYLPLVFTNVSAVTCTLYGYPGVAGLNSAGHQVAQARRETGLAKVTITLLPGANASALVHATVVPAGTTTCPPDYAALLVTPPNTTVAVRVAATLPSCGGLSVRPVVAGSSGL